MSDDGEATIADRYDVVRPLGRGSFGRTVLARDRVTDRMVAVKLLDPRGAADWKARELFEREALVLRSLRHAGIPEMHDLATDTVKGVASSVLVMEYIEGISIADVIEQQGSMDGADAVKLFVRMLGILEYLHERVPPVLHRDIKPANIILRPDGSPALVDFGSVRSVGLGPEESGSTVAGTYGYMPYEQYMGQASPVSDLYALAATFLHLVTRRPPRDFMAANGSIQVPDHLPGAQRLRPILARLLRTSPAERLGSARVARQSLQAVGAPLVALPVATAAPPRIGLSPGAGDALLAPRPRAIEGSTARLLDRLAPGMMHYMDGSAKRTDRAGVLDILSLVALSVCTLGVLPLVFLSIARSRRRRVMRFLRDGVPTLAQIINIRLEDSAFTEKLARVSYQFDVDGTVRRDSDQVLPRVADRWQPGDMVEILYILDDEYDSIVISTG